MNYKEINLAIMEDRDVDYSLIEKTEKFYQYLFNNKVAYFYANNLSTVSNKTEEWIISKGKELNEKYYKTIKEIKRICDKNNIEWVLYKTHKYIDEVVDGDIDLFVKKEDFQKFLDAFEGEGFECEEDEEDKGSCKKNGFLEIEPHCHISWRSNIFLSNEKIWKDKNIQILNVKNSFIKNISIKLELSAIYGELIFSPEYIDLLTYKKLLLFREDLTIDNNIKNLLVKLKDNINYKFPFFLSLFYIFDQIKNRLSFPQKIEILFKNFYWKYRYKKRNILPFTHNWKKI